MHETNKVRTTPGDFFLHLGIIVTLYISSVSLVNLLFEVINHAFPDRLERYFTYNSSAVLWATAFLIIMFPLYILLGWIYNKQLAKVPEKKQLAIRKWLVYLTLFIAGLALAIDLVTVVYYFLNGEITARFILKALTVFVVAGLVFGYYLSDVRATAAKRGNIFKAYGIVALVLVIASIITSFAVVGSPVSQRKVRFDQQRVGDLSNIQWQVISYWQRKGALPPNLEATKDPISSYMIPNDPETDAPYEYTVTGPMSFKLCATFSLPTQDMMRGTMPMPSMIFPAPAENDTWKHEAGKTCFDRTIDPDFYPPITEKERLMRM